MLGDLDITPADPDEPRVVNRLSADEVQSRALPTGTLRHRLAGRNRHRFGLRSESPDQPGPALEEDERVAGSALDQARPAEPEQDEPARRHSRRPLPGHPDRHDGVLSPGEDCGRCGGKPRTLGEDVIEEAEYGPGRFVVNRIVRPRKACACREAIVQSPRPSRPIERGRPGPGLLAHVLVSRYADHLPLCRQSRIHAREGVDIDRSTMSDRVVVARHCRNHWPMLSGEGYARGGVLADDTPVRMQVPDQKKTGTARVRTYVRDERPWTGQSRCLMRSGGNIGRRRCGRSGTD